MRSFLVQHPDPAAALAPGLQERALVDPAHDRFPGRSAAAHARQARQAYHGASATAAPAHSCAFSSLRPADGTWSGCGYGCACVHHLLCSCLP